jgi:hypothetical protein
MEVPMRQSSINHAPALRSLISAIPDDRLRELVLEMLLATLTTPVARPREPKPPAPAKRPLGKKRGRPRGPRKSTLAAAAADEKLAQQRQRDAALKREKRAAARAARQAKPNGSNGRNSPEITSAQTLWQHAEKLQPKAPWRAIVREFGINEAVAQDAHRTHKLPPGITGDAVTRFLELPAD